jgi:hypothetical protein
MKLRLPRRRVWRVSLYVLSALLIALAIDVVIVQIDRHVPINHETTWVTEPLLPDGRVDYLAAVENHFGAGVTSENNAAVPMIEAFGRAALPKNQPRDGITNRLGMPPVAEEGPYFVREDEKLDAAPLTTQPWAGAQHADVADWLKRNEIPFAKLAEASKRSRYYIPFNGGYRPPLLEVQLPHLQLIRLSCRALAARAMMRFAGGDVDGARADLMTVHRLSRLVAQGATLIDQLVAFVCDGGASRAEQAIAASGKLSQQQIVGWQRELSSLTPWPALGERVDFGERYFTLDVLQEGARMGNARFVRFFRALVDQPWQGEPPQGFSLAYAGWELVPIRYAETMRLTNVLFDEMVQIESYACYPHRLEAIEASRQKLEGQGGGGISAAIAPVSAPSMNALTTRVIGQVAARQTIMEADARLARAALLLADRFAQQRSYPKSLDELPSPPSDPFTEKPFIYRTSGNGYILYSVGPNLKDDAGIPPAEDKVFDAGVSGPDDRVVKAGS